MKNYLILIVLMMLFASCGNKLTVKLNDSHTKVLVTDFEDIYLQKDTIVLYYSTGGEYSISNNPVKDNPSDRYVKGIVIKKN